MKNCDSFSYFCLKHRSNVGVRTINVIEQKKGHMYLKKKTVLLLKSGV